MTEPETTSGGTVDPNAMDLHAERALEACDVLIEDLEQVNDTATYLPNYKVGKMVARALRKFSRAVDNDLDALVEKLMVEDRPSRKNGG